MKLVLPTVVKGLESDCHLLLLLINNVFGHLHSTGKEVSLTKGFLLSMIHVSSLEKEKERQDKTVFTV